MSIKSYKDLIVWQKSILLVKEVFLLTEKFPKSELYGLCSQLRRASISVPSNIAEGSGRKSLLERRQFYSIAYGSALEVETQIIIAKELFFAKPEDFASIDIPLNEILRMLNVMTARKT
ncbi:MAG: four helix bundle protein [bacterium]|nr:four helix bundle protein [bacterium]